MQNGLTLDDVQEPLTFDSISPKWAERPEQERQQFLYPLNGHDGG